jgi:hypothetical protein
MDFMLDSIEQVLPLGTEEWAIVVRRALGVTRWDLHVVQRLKGRQFQSLYNMQIPTGNPQCPYHVCRAKRLRYRIEEHSDASNMVNGNGADLGFADEEEESGEEGSNDAAAQAP